jgi:transcriptional antiterminator NusG
VSTCGRSDALVGETRRSRRREPQAFDAGERLRVGRVDGGTVRARFGPAGTRDETEGGEALAVAAVEIFEAGAGPAVLSAGAERASIAPPAPWHVVWTHSHCDQLVCDQLTTRGFHPFFPSMGAWSTRAGRRRLISVPMFPGYVFLNDALDKAAHVEVRRARGIAGILGEGWDRPAQVPEEEIQAIRQVVDSRLPTLPHPYLTEGRRVRIAAGPLAGLEGILVRARPARGLLVLSVHLLQRSVVVEVDWTHVMPV